MINKSYRFIFLVNALILTLITSCSTSEEEKQYSWYFSNFTRSFVNPILEPNDTSQFYCPLRKDTILWEYKDVFNPAAITKDNEIYLLYRAEDTVGRYNGTSRIGLAISKDGMNFERIPGPVLYPANDFMKRYEWEGGVEDPRIILSPEGEYIMTYTAYDGQVARLCVATSTDLISWQKQGLAFKSRRYRSTWSKSGSIVGRYDAEGNLIAEKINGKYWMYWGDTNIFTATSDNLTDWVPNTNSRGELIVSFGPREKYFDSRLVEPGPPAILTEDGILLLYNGMNLEDDNRDKDLAPGTYSSGQVLMSLNNPAQVLNRTSNYFLTPQNEFEIKGQIGNVCFIEGLVRFQGNYLLYYGTADSKIGLIISDEDIGISL